MIVMKIMTGILSTFGGLWGWKESDWWNDTSIDRYARLSYFADGLLLFYNMLCLLVSLLVVVVVFVVHREWNLLWWRFLNFTKLTRQNCKDPPLQRNSYIEKVSKDPTSTWIGIGRIFGVIEMSGHACLVIWVDPDLPFGKDSWLIGTLRTYLEICR